MSKYIEERKDKGFNYSNEPIQYNKIPKDKIGEALKDFSEGSVSLEKCLSVLWKKELFTIACCKGDHLYKGSDTGSMFGEAYIAFEPGINIFDYLSEEIIKNNNIEISNINNKQTIYFYGKDKDILILLLANDVLSGKKENQQLIEKKLEKQIDKSVLIESFINRLKVNGLLEEEIMSLVPIVDFIINSQQDEKVLISELNEAIEKYNSLLNLYIDKHNSNVIEDTQELPVIKK